MTQPTKLPLSRILLFSVMVFVFGVGGVLSGYFIRRALSPKPKVVMRAPESLLKTDMDFPEVFLTTQDGQTVGATELRGDAGCVVLFLDLDCPPCGDMAEKWQEVLASGRPPDLHVFAVTNYPVGAIKGFQLDHGITFPIVQDAGGVFRTTYKVNRFPLEVVVGASGKIRSVSYDADAPVDRARLSRLLADDTSG